MTTDTNITEGFIAMVEAYKAKPQLEATINTLTEDRNYFQQSLFREEATSADLRTQIAELNAKLLEVSRERDDAMFRNLELEELKDKIGGLLGQGLAMFKAPVVESASAVAQPDVQTTVSSEAIAETLAPEPQHEPAPLPTEPVPEPFASSPAPVFDDYDTKTYSGQPYYMKPWWVNDTEWATAGGKPNLAEPIS